MIPATAPMLTEDHRLGISSTTNSATNPVIDQDLFELAAVFHINHNLRMGLEDEIIEGGQMYLRKGRGLKPVTVGKEIGLDDYGRLLLIVNGSDIAKRLQGIKVVDPERDLRFRDISGINDFVGYLGYAAFEDGAVIYDRDSGRVTRQILNPHAKGIESIISEEYLPPEIIDEDGELGFVAEDGGSRVGTRTSAAFKVSRGITDKDGYHPVDAILIKGTVYNSLGFGLAARMSQDQIETFHFRYDPEAEGPFLDEAHKIIGVLRNYFPDATGRYALVHEQQVHLNLDNRLCYSCGEQSGQLVYQNKSL